MPPLSTKTKQYHRERVRSLIVQNPHISDEGIRKTLEVQGLTVDRHYIGSLLKATHENAKERRDIHAATPGCSGCSGPMSWRVRDREVVEFFGGY
jgi:hypothetical protein